MQISNICRCMVPLILVLGSWNSVAFAQRADSGYCRDQAERASRDHGTVMGGAARGAAKGAVFGAIVGGHKSSRRGAGFGAVAGGISRGASKNNTYNRVYDDCMRGYY